ncbi:MAG: hypothetical protein IBX61_01650 [Thermoleophilia bacterium]|nr:hypothetical protein [Thermoleophilia bacterium]
MKDLMQNHPKITTLAMIGLASLVVLFLYYLSIQEPSLPSSSEPIIAHGRSGPVATGEGIGSGAGSPSFFPQGIRDLDFESLLDDAVSGGWILENVIYTDIDGNGTEEAVVLLRGKGDSRPLNWSLYGLRGDLVELFYERSNVAHGELTAAGPQLVEREGVFAEGDAPCCPSSMKETHYVWKGDWLVVSRIETGPVSPTP